jgi:hypothetical protein
MNTKLVGDGKIEAEPLAQMRDRGGSWAVYQNIAMDSADLGRLQFIKFGPGCTHETAPEKCPDTAAGLGWKYALVGVVDLATGEIKET